MKPASGELFPEPAIIAGLAKATLRLHSVPWDEWTNDYAKIRMRSRRHIPKPSGTSNGGFRREDFLDLFRRERKWVTANGKANLTPLEAFPGPVNAGTDRRSSLGHSSVQ